ncbi:MAG: Elongation factor 4 [Candidatus Jorgensenbacteria bacterium GW2011_GWA1_48_11]|uniref:Elongation factor 4 n=1 Tax=Candidatus Jorgensenbacteria bacterium GW2011_GWA1_48_11 TaxID=1618660 RepID=A0A0G1X9V3_9BACT|nr:MAG: Elongation factor 4 [Candidatus Jorgensenbacteria bacterium GW2011_GWA1_48_11]KKW11769.1 MAG: Elongation factor 4 [Candidatus Jorgensenbacteria bacterium GW2011_GWB1_49_9]
MNNIRNFCIIAHIDHGKSTLADRFLEITKTVEARRMKAQYLDQLELERERGITIKMAPVRMVYRPAEIINPKSEIPNKKGLEIRNSKLEIASSEYILNLIDTPGHSDFAYEVSRAFETVEGAIILVDVSQGIQAQTLANLRAAEAAGLTVIGALSKIDLLENEPEKIKELRADLADLLKVKPEEIFSVSGKTGKGAKELLEAVIEKVPAPKEPAGNRFLARALIFDSFYDNHKGVVASIRVFNGEITDRNEIYLLASETRSKIKEVGYFLPQLVAVSILKSGEIGYIATGIKDPAKIKIGDTILILNSQISISNFQTLALAGYKEPKPVVFVSFYPADSDDYESLVNGLEKLHLNDSSLAIEPDQNEVLGRGFKIGFLGRLHFEITAERLRREFKIETVNTFPSVLYRVKTKNLPAQAGGWQEIVKPEDLPQDFEEILEPMVRIEIIVPSDYLQSIYPLQGIFRMKDIETSSFSSHHGGRVRMKMTATMPLAELVSDFDDKLKSVTAGYASFSYEIVGYEKADIEKLDILVAGKIVPGLSRFFPKDTIEREARSVVSRLKKLLPRQQYAQSLQASAKGRIIAREDIPALRKDVTGYLYGGDRSRKMKLWKKQQRGKKRLKERSEAKISADVFKELLKRS